MHANSGNGTRNEPARCQLQMSDPCPKQPQHTELPPVKHSASWHLHLKTATESTVGPESGILQHPLHLQATPPSAGSAGRTTSSAPSHLHTRGPVHKPGQAGPRVSGAGCLNPCCTATHSILAFLRRSSTGSTKLPREVATSRAGFVWPS